MPLRLSATACQTSCWKANAVQPRAAIQASARAPGSSGSRSRAALMGVWGTMIVLGKSIVRESMKRRCALAALLALCACVARAQSPDTLRLVTGFAPGGATDRVARIVGDK